VRADVAIFRCRGDSSGRRVAGWVPTLTGVRGQRGALGHGPVGAAVALDGEQPGGGVEPVGPAAVVEEVVGARPERREVVEVVVAALAPWPDVVDVGEREGAREPGIRSPRSRSCTARRTGMGMSAASRSFDVASGRAPSKIVTRTSASSVSASAVLAVRVVSGPWTWRSTVPAALTETCERSTRTSTSGFPAAPRRRRASRRTRARARREPFTACRVRRDGRCRVQQRVRDGGGTHAGQLAVELQPAIEAAWVHTKSSRSSCSRWSSASRASRTSRMARSTASSSSSGP
jgi:hypothetical protein